MDKERDFSENDIVVVIKCPTGWHLGYDANNCKGHISNLSQWESEKLNAGSSTSIGDNRTFINYTKDCLRLATEDEITVFLKGTRNINEIESLKLKGKTDLEVELYYIQKEIHG